MLDLKEICSWEEMKLKKSGISDLTQNWARYQNLINQKLEEGNWEDQRELENELNKQQMISFIRDEFKHQEQCLKTRSEESDIFS